MAETFKSFEKSSRFKWITHAEDLDPEEANSDNLTGPAKISEAKEAKNGKRDAAEIDGP